MEGRYRFWEPSEYTPGYNLKSTVTSQGIVSRGVKYVVLQRYRYRLSALYFQLIMLLTG